MTSGRSLLSAQSEAESDGGAEPKVDMDLSKEIDVTGIKTQKDRSGYTGVSGEIVDRVIGVAKAAQVVR